MRTNSSTFDPPAMAKDADDGRETGAGFTGPYQKPDGPNSGTVYVVGGNSGKTSGGGLKHPVMVTSRNRGTNCSAEHGDDLGGGCGEGVDVGFGVVEGEGGAGGAGDAEAGHERLTAVVTGADGDAHLI